MVLESSRPCMEMAEPVLSTKSQSITFGTSGNCHFIAFQFVPNDPPPGFSNKQQSDGAGATVSYDYDGSPIPTNGYSFSYTTDTPAAGNGTGVIKNS